MFGGTALLNSTVNGATVYGATSVTLPASLTSLLAFFASLSSLRDYFKLVALGGALEALRRLHLASSLSVVDKFFVTASFDSSDESFQWMMFWLSSIPQWRQFRTFTVSTSTRNRGVGSILPGSNREGLTRGKNRPVRYLPAYTTIYRMWYKRHWMKVSRVKEEYHVPAEPKSTLTITILSLDRAVMDAIILEARQLWTDAHKKKIDVYSMDNFGGRWHYVASQPMRPFNTVILNSGVKEGILEDAREFLNSRKWYTERGIPFRRGYLLHGTPGSGKTSLIHSLAGELGLDIYIIALSKHNLDDTTLNSLISALPPECVAIMEDIDVAFTRGLTCGTAGTEVDPQDPDPYTARPGHGESSKNITRITLSGLLNALDGVSAQEGRLLFATTNRRSVLDPALSRPGRMDMHVEFHLASRYQAQELFRLFYVPEHAQTGAAEDDTRVGFTPKEKASSASGDFIDLAADPDGALSKKRVGALAARFADGIPEHAFSMASLQGYLMGYKTRPVQAAEHVVQWVEEKQGERGRTARCRVAWNVSGSKIASIKEGGVAVENA